VRSLRFRLLAGFGLVIALSLFMSGSASVLLLRDQQVEAAEQRIGRLVDPLSQIVEQMESGGWERDRIRQQLAFYARYYDVRILLLDPEQRVVLDTSEREPMLGTWLPVPSEDTRLQPTGEVVQFRTARTSAEGQDLYLFSAAQAATAVSAALASVPRDLELVVAVPAADVNSAWAQLLPRLALAGSVAALAAVVVGTVIAARITRPIRAVTRASEAMARGDYEQRIDVGGHDEVAALASAFNAMSTQVTRSHRSMRQLLANVSHELKTPLTSIQGFSQAMVDGVVDDAEESARLATVIHEEAHRVRVLVDDLLYLSQIESGELALADDDVDLDGLMQATADRFRFQADAVGVELRVVRGAGEVVADGRRLEQVLANLVDNAIRFSPAGSAVTLRGSSEAEHALVEVHNRGDEIPEEVLTHLFDRFYQADPARGEQGHTGLGLAIVQELVQAHGGTVAVRSTAALGTTFTARLPREGRAAE
jgi:signal transduction histidine kinase